MVVYSPTSFRTAILHIDCDAFFASCEQAVNPALKGKPVVTGRERGIVVAASYEAKAFGVQRGVTLHEARQLCPDLIVVPSNYETYALFSKRLFAIVRRFSSEVEEYGIEESFIDITGLRRPLNMSYPQIAAKMKESVETELGITVSIGLAPSKVLAKVGSKWNKPSGLVVIRNSDRLVFLRKLDLIDVWGIGPQTTRFLQKHGMRTAADFAQKREEWIEEHMAKPQQEIWHELNGRSVMRIQTAEKHDYASISKTRTFTPASSSREFVFGQLSKNIENAFIKARRHNVAAQRLSIFLKTQEFRYRGVEAVLNRATSFPNEVIPLVRQLFDTVFVPGTPYRASGVTLHHLQPDQRIQMNLFEKPLELDQHRVLFDGVDKLDKRYGKHTVFLGSSFPAQQVSQHQNYCGQIPEGKKLREHTINKRKFVNLPFLLGEVK